MPDNFENPNRPSRRMLPPAAVFFLNLLALYLPHGLLMTLSIFSWQMFPLLPVLGVSLLFGFGSQAEDWSLPICILAPVFMVAMCALVRRRFSFLIFLGFGVANTLGLFFWMLSRMPRC